MSAAALAFITIIAILAALVAPAFAEVGVPLPREHPDRKDCIQYDEQVITLTGTVLVRKAKYARGDDQPPEGNPLRPYLLLDRQICAWGTDDESEHQVRMLQIADKCSRNWRKRGPSRVRVTGTLYHASNWHHQTNVLIHVEKIMRLDGRSQACAD